LRSLSSPIANPARSFHDPLALAWRLDPSGQAKTKFREDGLLAFWNDKPDKSSPATRAIEGAKWGVLREGFQVLPPLETLRRNNQPPWRRRALNCCPSMPHLAVESLLVASEQQRCAGFADASRDWGLAPLFSIAPVRQPAGWRIAEVFARRRI
jgi:hypothetical protein